jgi:hypothetical protein
MQPRSIVNRRSLIKQYGIINQCLQLLDPSDLPTMEKRFVETRLIRIKRLLLDNAIPDDRKGESFGVELFEGLLCRIRKTCEENREGKALADLLECVDSTLAQLSDDQANC